MHVKLSLRIMHLTVPDPKLASFPLSFTKMQALGNDFVVVDGRDLFLNDVGLKLLRSWRSAAPTLAQELCNRHTGIGADGLILMLGSHLLKSCSELKICPADAQINKTDIGWIYTNGDGSPSDMCGNGLRCVVLLSHSHKLVAGHVSTIYTDAGPISCRYDSPSSISIDLGKPKLHPRQIPLSVTTTEQFVHQPLLVSTAAREYRLQVTCLSMGNPHCVIFNEYTNVGFADPELTALAAEIQDSSLFPQGVNVEFASVLAPDRVRVLVWERGCGPTLACASGAAATVVAGVLEKKIGRDCAVELPGGRLSVSWSESDDHVRITGPAHEVFEGQIDLLKFEALRGLLPAEATCSQ
jgi:diaminopimelate epimerase